MNQHERRLERLERQEQPNSDAPRDIFREIAELANLLGRYERGEFPLSALPESTQELILRLDKDEATPS